MAKGRSAQRNVLKGDMPKACWDHVELSGFCMAKGRSAQRNVLTTFKITSPKGNRRGFSQHETRR